jgi:hypothetical protein
MKRVRVISSPVNHDEWIVVPPTPNNFSSQNPENKMLWVQNTPERERELMNSSTILSVEKHNDIREEEEDDERSDFSCFSPVIQKHHESNNK